MAEPYVPDSGSVGFDIEPRESKPGSVEFMATYGTGGKSAKFIVLFEPESRSEAKSAKDFPISFGKGEIVAVPGSDATALLSDLRTALEATKVPNRSKRANSVSFTFANLGTNLSQARDGGFNEKPVGDWTAMKLFLGEGEQQAEVFLNFNLKSKKGQFSIKDPDYGDLVLAQLAKVL